MTDDIVLYKWRDADGSKWDLLLMHEDHSLPHGDTTVYAVREQPGGTVQPIPEPAAREIQNLALALDELEIEIANDY